MAQRPAFGSLKKTKPAVDAIAPSVVNQPEQLPPPAAPRIQTSIRLTTEEWAALNGLATRKRVETGRRVTAHALVLEGIHHILAINGVKLSKQQDTEEP